MPSFPCSFISRLLLTTSIAFAAAAAKAQTAPTADAASGAGGSATGSGDQTLLLNPVVITGTLDQAREDIVPALGATSYQVNADQIDTQAQGDNASFNQVLLRTPSMAEDSYGQVHLRGEHANLQYRINDVLLPEGITGFGQELDVPFVKTLAVETGSLPAQYGYRTAGVVDIHTESGATLGDTGSLTIYGGSFDTLRVSADSSAVAGQMSAFVTTSAQTDNLGIENPTGSSDPIHDRTDQLKFFGDFSYLVDSTSRITLMIGSSSSTFQIPDNPGQTPVFSVAGAGAGSDNSANLNENQDEYNDYAILAYQKSVGDFSGQISVFTRYSLTHFTPDVDGDLIFNGVASDVYQDLVSNGFEADGKWALGSSHTLRAGAEVMSTNANTSTLTDVFPVDADGNPTSDVPYWIEDDHHKLGWLYGAYAQDEWKPLPGLTVNYGLRADESQGYLSEGQLSPRFNLVYQLDPVTTVHAGYARYFTPPPLELEETPTLSKFTGTSNESAVTQNSPIRSERADYFDTGISRQFGPDFSVTVDAYYKKATNQIDEGQFGAALIFATFNYRIGHVYGGDISANYTHGGFSAYANIAPGRAFGEQITSGQFQFAPDELAYIATHEVHLDHDQALTASAGASYRLEGSKVFADFLYGSGLRSGFANTDHVPEYHPLNAGLEHVFVEDGRHRLTGRLDVVNVFDEVYELRDGSGIGVFAPQYGQRRGIFGSLGWTF